MSCRGHVGYHASAYPWHLAQCLAYKPLLKGWKCVEMAWWVKILANAGPWTWKQGFQDHKCTFHSLLLFYLHAFLHFTSLSWEPTMCQMQTDTNYFRPDGLGQGDAVCPRLAVETAINQQQQPSEDCERGSADTHRAAVCSEATGQKPPQLLLCIMDCSDEAEQDSFIALPGKWRHTRLLPQNTMSLTTSLFLT